MLNKKNMGFILSLFCMLTCIESVGMQKREMFKTMSVMGKQFTVFEKELEDAIASGDVGTISQYVIDGQEANARSSLRETVLHLAAQSGNVKAIEFLLARGARPNVINEKGITPLHEAARRYTEKHAEAVKVLLKAGACPSAEDKSGWTPLHFAARTNSESVQLLLDACALKNTKTDNGFTPLDLAYEAKKSEAIEKLRSAGAQIGRNVK